MGAFKDLTGQKFGRLTVVNFAGKNKHGKSLYRCRCSCGAEKTIIRQGLVNKTTQSCGCIKKPHKEEYYDMVRKRLKESIIIDERGCWVWQKSLHNNFPHGSTCFVENGKKRNHPAHRISYKVFIGDIPDGIFVLHDCDNPSCINPDHLHLGTQQDNINEMIERGRANNESKGKKGIDHNKAKLDEKQILEIRDLYESNIKICDIKKLYNVTWENISAIVKNKTWNHI